MLRWGIILGLSFICSAFASPGEVDIAFKSRLPTNYHVGIAFEQSDGRLLVGGNIAPAKPSGPFRFFLRLRSNGQVDKSFNATRHGADVSQASDITERADGKIGVIGSVNFGRKKGWHSAALLRRNGTVDPPYVPITNFNSGAWLPDGSIVYAGRAPDNSYYAFATVRTLSPDGQTITEGTWLNSSSRLEWLKALPDGKLFGLGVIEFYSGDIFYGLYSNGGIGGPGETVQPDGSRRFHGDGIAPKMSIAAGASNTVYVGRYRYLSNRVDNSFTMEFPGVSNLTFVAVRVRAVAVQQDGKPIFVASICQPPCNTLFRCNTDGSLDPGFNVGSGAHGEVKGLLTLRSGKILAWGDFTEFNGISAPALVRLNTE